MKAVTSAEKTMKKSFVGRCPSGRLLTGYVEGTLSTQQQFRVEDHLLDCPLCESAIAAFTLHGTSTTQPKTTSPTKLKSLPQPRRSYWPTLTAAATILLLLFAGWQYWAASENERLFDTYFDAQPIYGFEQQRIVNRKESEQEISLRNQAQVYHLEGNYRKALMSWRAYFDAGTATDSWLPFLYAANAAMATGNSDEAAYFMDQLPPKLEGAQGEQLQWYRAMLDLKQGQLGLAKTKLEALIDGAITPYGKIQAADLLKKIE